MNTASLAVSPFWSIVWKEYRQSRSFWLAMVAIGVASQMLVQIFKPQSTYDGLIVNLPLVWPALYAIGVGSTMFAVEHEERTFDFLRRLPTSAGTLFFAKLAFALLSIMAMQLILLFTGSLLAHQVVFSSTADNPIALWGLAGLEGLAWGMACSILIRWPLRAAIAALVLTTLSFFIASIYADYSGRAIFEPTHYTVAVRERLAVVVAIALLDLWLASRWFDGKWFSGLWSSRVTSPMSIGAHTILQNTRGQEFRSLLWQTWRQARWAPLLFIPLAFPTLVSKVAMPWVVIVSALWGSFVFRADQQYDSRRFLAQRGIFPAMLWLSRLIVWGLMSQLWMIIPVGAMVISWWLVLSKEFDFREIAYFLAVGYLLAYGLLAFASGQLTSQFIRSGILAGVSAVLLAGLFAGWAWLMLVVQINWLWTVFPIIIALFAATWVRTPGWLLERNDWRAWLRPVLALILPIAVVISAVGTYRVIQIPAVVPDFGTVTSVVLKNSATEETRELYLRAWERQAYGKSEPEIEEAIALTLEASKRDQCYLNYHDFQATNDVQKINGLAAMLMQSATRLGSKGKLDEAFDHYLAILRISRHVSADIRTLWVALDMQRPVLEQLPIWAARSQQTPERIDTAIKQLEEFHATLPAPSATYGAEYEDALWMVDNVPEVFLRGGWINAQGLDPEIWVEYELFPERIRARRLINFLVAEQLNRWKGIERQLASGQHVGGLAKNPAIFGPNGLQIPRDIDHWLRTTPLAELNWLTGGRGELPMKFVLGERQFRATITILAIESYRLKHDKLPSELKKLVGSELKQLLQDPFTGHPFGYYPKGVSEAEQVPNTFLGSGQPFLWSPVKPNGENVTGLMVSPQPADISAYAVFEGMVFPIPSVGDEDDVEPQANEAAGAVPGEVPFGAAAPLDPAMLDSPPSATQE